MAASSGSAGGYQGCPLFSFEPSTFQLGMTEWALNLTPPPLYGILATLRCGCSSVVERLLAKETVVGSNPIARSAPGCRLRRVNAPAAGAFRLGDVAKW